MISVMLISSVMLRVLCDDIVFWFILSPQVFACICDLHTRARIEGMLRDEVEGQAAEGGQDKLLTVCALSIVPTILMLLTEINPFFTTTYIVLCRVL